MIEGTLNGKPFKAPVEPDGRGGHWFKLEKPIATAAQASAGKSVSLEFNATKSWTKPTILPDLKAALAKAPAAQAVWQDITPAAQWEWIRWIRSTNVAETRQRRVEVAISKMTKGMRRPCCFNRNMCTEPYVSKNWMLREA